MYHKYTVKTLLVYLVDDRDLHFLNNEWNGLHSFLKIFVAISAMDHLKESQTSHET